MPGKKHDCGCGGCMPEPNPSYWPATMKKINRTRSVYLAGPITGCDYDGCTDWREAFKKMVNSHIECYSPMRGKDYLKDVNNISARCQGDYPLSIPKGIVTRDRFDVQNCDLVVMNLKDAARVSIGTMVEVGWADAYRKPIVLIRNEDDKIHAHAFLDEIAGYVVTTLEEAAKLVNVILTS